MGSNMAECHPVGFQWVMEAKERGAKVIHVDPRFTRTSAMADLHVPLRAGSDIAFLGGIVNYILENEREFREYVREYTNARVIINEDFADTEDLDGFFSGWNADDGLYDITTWSGWPILQGIQQVKMVSWLSQNVDHSARVRKTSIPTATINAEIAGHAEKTSGSARSARSALYVVRYSRQAGKNFLTMTNSQTHRIGF